MKRAVVAAVRGRRGAWSRLVDPPAPAGVFSDGYDTFGFVGNEDFSSVSPTFKNDVAITGSALTYYNSAIWAMQNANTTGDDTWEYANWAAVYSNSDVYNSARDGQRASEPLLAAFRLTGDLRILDRLGVVLAGLPWTVAWVGSYWTTEYPDGPSPYDKLLYRGGGDGVGLAFDGTDVHTLNNLKMGALLAKYAWVFHLNRGKVSPTYGAGHYATLADLYGQHTNDFVRAWSVDTAAYTSGYEGDDYHINEGYRERAPAGTWPVFTNNGSHSAMDGVTFQRYAGLLANTGLWPQITNGAGALAAASELAGRLIPYGHVACTVTATGEAALVPRASGWLTHINIVIHTRSQQCVYLGHTSAAAIELWMSGAYRTELPLSDMQKIARTVAAATSADGSMVANTGTVVTGDGLDDTGGTARTAVNTAVFGHINWLVFEEPGDTALMDAATSMMTNVVPGGSIGQPQAAALPAAQFLKLALTSVGDIG